VLGHATVDPRRIRIGADALEFRTPAWAKGLSAADRAGVAAREQRGLVVKRIVVAVIAVE
jgi:hypothetical protein